MHTIFDWWCASAAESHGYAHKINPRFNSKDVLRPRYVGRQRKILENRKGRSRGTVGRDRSRFPRNQAEFLGTTAGNNRVLVDFCCHRGPWRWTWECEIHRQGGRIEARQKALGWLITSNCGRTAPRGVLHGCTGPRRPWPPPAEPSPTPAPACHTTTEFNCSINHYFRDSAIATVNTSFVAFSRVSPLDSIFHPLNQRSKAVRSCRS